jgi:pentose-5-phosphate-3-epimerase
LDPQTAQEVIASGANIIVSGTATFNSCNVKRTIKLMRGYGF